MLANRNNVRQALAVMGLISLTACVSLDSSSGLKGRQSASPSPSGSPSSSGHNTSPMTAAQSQQIYYPLTEGSSWTSKIYTYDSKNGSGKPEGSVIDRIFSFSSVTDPATATIKHTDFDKDGKETEKTTTIRVIKSDGIYSGKEDGKNLHLYLPLPFIDGTRSIEPATTSIGSSTTFYMTEVVGTIKTGESVVLDIGKFDNCVKITKVNTNQFRGTYYKADSTASVTEWYAPKVGRVKYQSDDETKEVGSSTTKFERFETEVSTYTVVP